MSNLDSIQSSSSPDSQASTQELHHSQNNLDTIEIPATAKDLNQNTKPLKKEINPEQKQIEQVKIPNDPVVVTQVLQVLDRDKYTELEKLVKEKEDVKDAIELIVNKIYKKQSGITSFVSAAFKGRKIPKDLASELDILIEYQQGLETYIDDMVHAIARSRDLTEKSEINADYKNKLVLRQRAIIELECVVESFELSKLRKNCAKLVKSQVSS